MKKQFLFLTIISLSFCQFLTAQTKTFDPQMAVLFDSTVFFPFEVKSTIALEKALQIKQVKDDDLLLIVQKGGASVAMLHQQMAYHHVAFGKLGGQPWMATFCVACNSGATFEPLIGQKLLHFEGVGIYDGVIILKDLETGSLWNHITGECLHGESKGESLPAANLLQMNARQAASAFKGLEIAISDQSAYAELPFFQLTQGSYGNYMPDTSSTLPKLQKGFKYSIKTPDERLPEMELGLGVWSGKQAKFYPMGILKKEGALLDGFLGQRILVFLDHDSRLPMAIFTKAKKFSLSGGNILLDTGEKIKGAVVYDKNGKELPTVDRPLQMPSRWYGFALAYPVVQIYQLHE